MKSNVWLQVVVYRIGQVRQQLGFVKPLSVADVQEVQHWLPTSALPLFATMSDADKQHSLRVCRGLQAQGCVEDDMLAAALLHDVGKAQGRVPFWTRPAIVLGKLFAPRFLARLVIAPSLVETDYVLEVKNEGIGKPTGDHKGRTLLYTSAYSRVRPLWSPVPRIKSERALSRPRSNENPKGRATSVLAWRRSLSYAWYHADVGADLAANAGLSQCAVLYIRTHHDPHGPAAALHRVDEVS